MTRLRSGLLPLSRSTLAPAKHLAARAPIRLYYPPTTAMARLRSVLRPLARSTLAPAKHLPLASIRLSSTSRNTADLKKSPLHDLHIAHGGKMVHFAGYTLPKKYGRHTAEHSHLFTRKHASLFDASHMVQHTFTGPNAAVALERLTPVDAKNLSLGHGYPSALLTPTGGIIDDLMVTRVGPEKFHVVSTAARRATVLDTISEGLRTFVGVDWSVEERAGLLSLQGPEAAAVMRMVLTGFERKWLFFGRAAYGEIILRDGTLSRDVLISRGGYTGEDGFEISLVLGQEKAPEDVARELTAIAEALLEADVPVKVKLAGLTARQTLRIEAGLCLCGQDTHENTTPVEAKLSFIIPKGRREEIMAAEEEAALPQPTEGVERRHVGFTGAEAVLPQLKTKSRGGEGVKRRRVGLVLTGAEGEGGAAPRGGDEILSKHGEKLGSVTSGCASPSLGQNIAMGYVRTGVDAAGADLHALGTEMYVVLGGERVTAVVTSMPFVETKYHMGSEFLDVRAERRREQAEREEKGRVQFEKNMVRAKIKTKTRDEGMALFAENEARAAEKARMKVVNRERFRL
ncbi:glycine cleavage system aminomethyltransferase GcvT, partial [Candidatus Bathyarchaeota archaeon]|nr:glycine cleavage system aminomethyltransferase GcvT [Candidatus Bathyarchaeota archaeon]